MLDVNEFRRHVVRPACIYLREGHVNYPLWTQAVENLLVGTAVQESGLRHLRQLERRPGARPLPDRARDTR